MRFIVYGAGAIGGVLGGRLLQAGHDVCLIARGAHFEAIRDRGLRIESPEGAVHLHPPVVDHPSRLTWSPEDVVLLTMKTQDTAAALSALALVAPSDLPVLCIQNGVENERMAARHFARVYGVYVWCPAGYLTPGVVEAWCAPTTGILDVGCYPAGTDEVTASTGAGFRSATFQSESRDDVMRWKYRKLLSNLGNALEALCGPAARGKGLHARAREEAIACFEAEGISFVADEECDAKRREQAVMPLAIDGRQRPGGSTWQSMQRHAGTIETDYLNGEICLLGRLHGIPTPVNALLQRLSNEMLRHNTAPGSVSPEQILAYL